ncbi:MAG: transcriptional repressor [Sulfuriferula sp.]
MINCTDHHACQARALHQAESLCQHHGARLTPLRRRVLELIWSSHTAVKAYDLLAQLSTEDHAAKPPTIYRALDFLLAQGLVHRVDSINAYVGCIHPESPHDVRLLICQHCGQVTELIESALDTQLLEALAAIKFRPTLTYLEVQGVCMNCQ